MNRLNIGSPWVESLFVTRAGARPMEFCYPSVHTNGPKLGSDCDEPMTVLLQLRELDGRQRNRITAFSEKPDSLHASHGKSWILTSGPPSCREACLIGKRSRNWRHAATKRCSFSCGDGKRVTAEIAVECFDRYHSQRPKYLLLCRRDLCAAPLVRRGKNGGGSAFM